MFRRICLWVARSLSLGHGWLLCVGCWCPSAELLLNHCAPLQCHLALPATISKDGIVIRKTWLPQRHFPNSFRRGIVHGCFASQPNGIEVGRSAASGISSVSLRRTLNAPKNTERGYLGLAPLYIGFCYHSAIAVNKHAL